MKKTTFLFAILIFAQTVCGQNCPRYFDLMKKAKILWTNGEFEMALNQLNAAREHCPLKSLEIDKQLVRFTNEISRKYQEANHERENAEISKKSAEEQTILARLAQKSAENALSIADSLTKVHIKTLESLGGYSKKEFYFEKFNFCKKNADIFFSAEMWDSSYFSYKTALDAADASPYIQTNKKYLYDRIEICIKNMIEQGTLYDTISKGDSLAKIGGFVRYAVAFDLFSEVSKNKKFKGDVKYYMMKVSDSIENELGEFNINNYKSVDKSKYPLAQLFLDVNNYLGIKENQNENIKNVLKKKNVRKVIDKYYKNSKIKRIGKTTLESTQEMGPVEAHLWNSTLSNFIGLDDFNNKINKNYSIYGSYGFIFHSNSHLISDSSKILKHKWLNNFYSGGGIRLRGIYIRSALIDTINIAMQSGGVLNIKNVEKTCDIDVSNLGLFKSYDYVSNKIRLFKTTPKHNVKVNIGVTLGGEITLETYSTTRTNIFLDSITFSPQIIENKFSTVNKLDKNIYAYMSIFSSGHIKFIYEGKNNRRTSFGIKISNLSPLHTNKQKKIYSNLREKHGIVGGAILNNFEFTVGFNLDYD